MDPIEMLRRIPKLIFPEELPKLMRIIQYVTIGFMTIVGFRFGVSALIHENGSFFGSVLLYVLIGIGCAALIGNFWAMLCNIQKKGLYAKADRVYQEEGCSLHLAECLKAGNMNETVEDWLMSAFVLTQCESYSEAEQALKRLNQHSLTSRQMAMYVTTQLRIYLMTARLEKAEILFHEQYARQMEIYSAQPDLMPVYKPYADDALDFYLMSFGMHAMEACDDAAELCRQEASFRVNQRDALDFQLYPDIMRLIGLNAAGAFQEAHDLQADLNGRIYSARCAEGKKRELNRLTEQARIFGMKKMMNRRPEQSENWELPL
ncbi:MAG: hypothetical protein MJ071_02205 [Oscillospiraceae bacterium]|nr:hypothetical protein [Oscillospiraceae bacterium]